MTNEIIHGDCIEVMRTMPANSVDSIVTDPPYGLGFMGKAWDALPPGEEWARECLRVLKPGGHLLAFGGTRTWHRLAVAVEDAGFEIRDSIAWMYGSGFPKHRAALKPAFEPIVMGRKTYKGSLTANEAIHGTGALNIDGCRVGGAWENSSAGLGAGRDGANANGPAFGTGLGGVVSTPHPSGRWPSNVVVDDAAKSHLDNQRAPAIFHIAKEFDCCEYGEHEASLYYTPKAPKRERPVVDGVAHATVKPLTLMRWLVKLVTPPGGTVLEPFAGSGTTVEACILEGFNVIAIEREAEYLPLIQARIDRQEAA